MIIDGRAIASDILAEVKAALAGKSVIVRAVVMQPSSATHSYLQIKTQQAEEAGMRLEVVRVADEANQEELVAAIEAPDADAVIVQLPLPKHLDLEAVLTSIPLEKDADVLSAAAYARFERNEPGALTPPVAAGVGEILARSGIDVVGMRAVVIGRGRLVGKPCATYLTHLGAQVISVDSATENREALYTEADLIVSGAGKAHVIRPDMIKEGAILIDAGTSGQEGGVAGDFHPECAKKARLFTPVPGGVGPVAVACLFKNVARLLGASFA